MRSPAAFAGWLFRVVHRLCMLPVLMARRGVESLSEGDERAQFALRSVDELRIDLVRAIESLPEPARQVVLLRDFEDLGIGEIAERLGQTREAVKSRLHRARLLLREYLVDSEDG